MSGDNENNTPPEALAFVANGHSAEYSAIISVAFGLIDVAKDLREIAYRIEQLEGHARVSALSAALARIAEIEAIARDVGRFAGSR